MDEAIGATERSPGAGSRARAMLATRVEKLDLRNTWQVAAGSILVPLGIVIILISWYGSAHTPYVQQQIPYLVSGSFIGLGMMIVGGLLYWAHWLYRLYDQADLHHQASMARQEELLTRLVDAATASPGRSSGGASGETPAATAAWDHPAVRAGRPVASAVARNGSARSGLVVTATGNNVHRPDCPIIQRHPAGARPIDPAEAADRPACRICQP